MGFDLIFSNDIIEKERMLELTRLTAEYIDGIKIGITSTMKPEIEIIKKVKDLMGEKPVLVDYKVADIGFLNESQKWQGTNAKIIRTLSEAGADYITCHTLPGISSIEECVKVAHENGSRVLTLPYMTHRGANLFFGMPLGEDQVRHIIDEFVAYGFDPKNEETFYESLEQARTISDVILLLGNYLNVDGYIGPGNNPDVIKRYRELTNKEIWSPGFGRQDKEGRTMDVQITEWASVVGSDSKMIVGSSIYKAEDPERAAKEIAEIRDKTIEKLYL